MRQDQVQIGGYYRVKIGGRLAPVQVMRQLPGRGRLRFECYTRDTNRVIKATAARLRPIPAGEPALALVRPDEIAGVRLAPRRLVERMERFNRSGIERFVDRQHVATPLLEVCRAFVRHVKRRSLRDFPPAFRRGAWHCVIGRHLANQREYRQVMGHAPLPTHEQVTAALLGDVAARRAVLAG